MSDRPLHDAIEAIPKNEIKIEGEASKLPGAKVNADLALTLEREKERLKGTESIGVTAGLSTEKGGYVAAFWKWVWK